MGRGQLYSTFANQLLHLTVSILVEDLLPFHRFLQHFPNLFQSCRDDPGGATFVEYEVLPGLKQSLVRVFWMREREVFHRRSNLFLLLFQILGSQARWWCRTFDFVLDIAGLLRSRQVDLIWWRRGIWISN